MDLLLPSMAGQTLTRYLRQHDVHASLPIVVCTTQGQVEARVEAVRAGADDFLLKPVEPGLLLSTVAARIERARFLRRWWSATASPACSRTRPCWSARGRWWRAGRATPGSSARGW